MKILHLIPDDGKTHQLITARFSEVESIENRYLIYSSSKPTSYVSNNNMLQFVEAKYWLLAKCKTDVKWCDVLMIHFMTPWAALVALHAKKNLPVFWCGWGGDYSRHISSVTGEIVLPATREVQVHSNALKKRYPISPFQLVISGAKKILGPILTNQLDSYIIKRVDYFSAPIPEDYELLKRARPDLRAKYHQLSYGTVETLFRNESLQASPGNILVGNSATSTNNHIEIFQQLRYLDFGARKLIVPLSYGDEIYREEIIKIGKAMFGANFSPLKDFMPLSDYNQLIGSCGTVIMNHKRQQALGNINTLLYQGARVFLNPDSVVYSFFKNRGAHVYSVTEIKAVGTSIFEHLTRDQIEMNRKILDEFWGHERVLRNICQLPKVIGLGNE